MTVDVRKELPDNYKFGWEDKGSTKTGHKNGAENGSGL